MDDIRDIKDRIGSFGFGDYLRNLKTVESMLNVSELQPLRLAILRSYTAEMIEPVLKLKLLLAGYNTKFMFGEFNQYAQEILDPGSPLYRFNPDVILLLIRFEDILPDLVDKFGELKYEQCEAIVSEAVQQLYGLTQSLEKNHLCQLIIQNVVPPVTPYWGGFDAQVVNSQELIVNSFNCKMTEKLSDKTNVFLWDFNRLVRERGAANIYEPKAWYTTRNPYKQKAYPIIAGELTRYLLSVLGRQKKCIILDLDNTLWGGIAGEDGMDGIQLGQDYPGNCYRDFQKELLKYYHRGIILAINSKNNEEDALEIIEKHPFMVLRKEHFAAQRINWKDKASNLFGLANDLNIGIESMVFIDDNPVECELIRQQHPECEVVCLPEKPYLIPEVLKDIDGFENLKLTAEDRQKGKMYQSQVKRKEFSSNFESLDDFLKGLEMEVSIEDATSFAIPRIAQLTQKTNQLNMTTRRYTEANIKSISDDPDRSVFSVSVKDRFGDNGVVGVFILVIEEKVCKIDTFLLSCRVISRHIEDVMIAFISEYASKKGIFTLIGEYIPTRKNKPASEIYSKFGFEKIDDTHFRADLKSRTYTYPSYIHINIKAH